MRLPIELKFCIPLIQLITHSCLKFQVDSFNGFGVTLIFARRAVKRAQAALPREDRSFLLKKRYCALLCNQYRST